MNNNMGNFNMNNFNNQRMFLNCVNNLMNTNDNIRILQYFLNRCFGIESTYLSEWDLSMYMQEGLCSFTEYKSDDGKETFDWVTSDITLQVTRADVRRKLTYKCVVVYDGQQSSG